MRTRTHYDNELATMQGELRRLGHKVVAAVANVLDALRSGEAELAVRVIAGDADVNQAERDLESHAVNLIATQQPVASDLRRVVAAIALGAELERIADYAKTIAWLATNGGETLLIKPTTDLIDLGEVTLGMLETAMSAIDAPDVSLARDLAAADDDVDRRYRQVKANLVASLLADPMATIHSADLLFVAHYFERIADRCTNIAERIIYEVDGTVVDLNP